MSATILYIHGFASCGAGNKVETLTRHFGAGQVLSPDLLIDPQVALLQLQALINTHEVALLVGSSLGGFYADRLNADNRIPSVLINPSTRPFDTLGKYVGKNTNWCSGETFEWKAEYSEILRSMYRDVPAPDENYLVLLQSADEVLDYRLAEARYRHHQVTVEQGGNHRFENFADYLPVIEKFTNGALKK